MSWMNILKYITPESNLDTDGEEYRKWYGEPRYNSEGVNLELLNKIPFNRNEYAARPNIVKLKAVFDKYTSLNASLPDIYVFDDFLDYMEEDFIPQSFKEVPSQNSLNPNLHWFAYEENLLVGEMTTLLRKYYMENREQIDSDSNLKNQLGSFITDLINWREGNDEDAYDYAEWFTERNLD
tara:strand:+ start:36 stop:578 length:543 start_codon:yes stop_codon:yes gene_type:complete